MSAPTPSEAVRVAVQQCRRLADLHAEMVGERMRSTGSAWMSWSDQAESARDELFGAIDALAALSLHVEPQSVSALRAPIPGAVDGRA